MDLTELYSTYERLPGENRVSPEIMLKIMLYAYHEKGMLSQMAHMLKDLGQVTETEVFIDGTKIEADAGYLREETHYDCNECDDCPYRETCMPGKNWKNPVEKRLKFQQKKNRGRKRGAAPPHWNFG